MTCFLGEKVSYIRNAYRHSKQIVISFVKLPTIPCLQWRNQTGMYDSYVFWAGSSFCLSPVVSRTDWKQHVLAIWERRGGRKEIWLWKKKTEAEREMGNSPHFLSLFIAICMCETCLQRQRTVWSLFSAWPGPISDKLSCVITIGSLAHQWTEATQ